MAIILQNIGRATNVPVKHYSVDTIQERDQLNVPSGTTCYVINEGKAYTINENKEWKLGMNK